MPGYSDHVWSREPLKLKMEDLDNSVLFVVKAFLSFIEAIASFLLHK